MKRLCYGLIASAVFGTIVYAASPSWWKARGVMPEAYDEESAEAREENFEAAKLGQLMNLAEKAAEELNENVPGGAGDAITELISGFKKYDPKDPDANYQALTAGRLKTVAAVFYGRLAELPETYVNYGSLRGKYPLAQEEGDSEEFASDDTVVNVGQLKNAFAWSLTSVASDDSDGDGIPDSWEMKYFGNLATANGTNCYNGDGISDLQKYQEGKDPTLPPEGSDLFLIVYTPLE